MIVPVLFLKSLQMLSVDGQLIVRGAAAVQAAPEGEEKAGIGRGAAAAAGSPLATASQKTYTVLHTAGKSCTQTSVLPLHTLTWH